MREITTGSYDCAITGDAATGFTATNTAKPVASLSATKTLDGAAPGERTFTFELYEGGSASGTPVQTKESASDGVVDFDDLVLDGAGTYVYTIHEVNDGQAGVVYDTQDVVATVTVSGEQGSYTTSVSYVKAGTASSTATFANTTVQAEKVDLALTKSWEDGATGSQATIALYRSTDGSLASDASNTAEFTGYTVTLDGTADASFTDDDTVQFGETGAWQATFKNLPKADAEGNEYTYSFLEVAADGSSWAPVTNYSVTYGGNAESGFTVVNQPSTETVDIPVEKKWDEGAQGEYAEIELVSNGETTGQTVTLNEDNGWKGSFDDLPKYDNSGNEITYTVVENTEVWNYTVESDGNGGFVVTNYPSTETVDIPVQKVWANGASGEQAVIELVADGQATGQTITLTEDNDWQGVFEGLSKYGNDGHEIVYSVTEQTSEWNYTVESDGNGGFIVTNYPKSVVEEVADEVASHMPKTGDSLGNGIWGILATAVAAFGVGLAARRKRDE